MREGKGQCWGWREVGPGGTGRAVGLQELRLGQSGNLGRGGEGPEGAEPRGGRPREALKD